MALTTTAAADTAAPDAEPSTLAEGDAAASTAATLPAPAVPNVLTELILRGCTHVNNDCIGEIATGCPLLRSITPPDPAKDWQDCMLILGNEVGFLKTIFRVYCLEGRSGTGDMDTVRALPRPIPTANRMA